MKRKIWLAVALLVVIIVQTGVLSSFFHPFQAEEFSYGTSIVEISKMSYVFGWVKLDITGASPQNPVTIQFPNGTQTVLTFDYSFDMKLPRTGDCLCSGATSLYETSTQINQSQPIVAGVVANASSFQIQLIPKSGSTIDGLVDLYWFLVTGDASVSINGYGLSY
jgi:hypothetical protein